MKHVKALWVWILFIPMLLMGQDLNENLEKANEAYRKGIASQSLFERKSSFNQALKLYLDVEEKGEGSSSLYRTIGDTYFQLGEYSYAILYYEKGIKLEAFSSEQMDHLRLAKEKLGLKFKAKAEPLLTPKNFNQLFIVVLLFTFILCSLMLWRPHSLVKIGAVFFIVLLMLLLMNTIVSFYFKPIEGVVVQTVGIYRAPSEKEALISTEPLWAGSEVEVLETNSGGSWLKIKDDQGRVGYVPAKTTKII